MSCSDDPSSPEDTEEVALATVNIGPEGGVVEEDNLSLVVPAGAFSENNKVSIFSSDRSDIFQDQTIGPTYRIDGLPKSSSVPLKLIIKHNQVNVTDEAYIAIGFDWFSEIDSDSSLLYSLNPSIDSSGYLVSTFQLIENYELSKSNQGKFWGAHPISYWVCPLLSYSELKTENYNISIPYSLSHHLNRLAELLEDCHRITMEKIGLSSLTTIDTAKVTIRTQKSPVEAGFTFTDGLVVNISRELVAASNFSKIKTVFGKRMIEIGLGKIILENMGSNVEYIKDKLAHSLVSSIQTWSEEHYSNDENFKYPENFLANYLAPFNGLRAGIIEEDTNLRSFNHSYGIASLIKYLVEKEEFGSKGIINTFKDIAKGEYPMSALINNVDMLFITWFPDFFKKYIMSEIYDVPTSYFLNDVHGTWSINSKNDTIKVFSNADDAYPDLSAKLFKVDLNYGGFESNQNMTLSMSGPSITEDGLSLVVFGIQEEEMIYLETANAQDFEIPNLKEYYDNDLNQFLVCLVNGLGVPPYTGKSNIDLEIRITQENDGGGGQNDLAYNLCRIDVYLQGLFEDTRWAEGTQIESPLSVGTSHDYWDYEDTVRTISGSFSGNEFIGNFSSGDGWTQTATVTLNEEHDKIIDFSFEENHAVWSGQRILRKVNGINVPVNINKRTLFEIRGENSLSSVFDIQEMVITNETDTSRVVDFWSDENSRVVIQFYKSN